MKTDKEHIKKELGKLFRSMDFVSKMFLADDTASYAYSHYINIQQGLTK